MHPNITKIIDQYLNNELSEVDKIAFESRLEEDDDLLLAIALQQQIGFAANRASQRELIDEVGRSYHLLNQLKWGLSVLTGTIIAGTLIYYFWTSNPTNVNITQFKPQNTIQSALVTDTCSKNEENIMEKVEFSADSILSAAIAENSEPEIPLHLTESVNDIGVFKSEITSNNEKEKIQFSELQAKAKKFVINPLRDTSILLNKNGTTLHIPAYSFRDKMGTTVTKNITIEYKEFNNQADIAFSGIPMTYNDGTEEFCFNSAGMFSLTGNLNGEAIEILDGKNLTMDYHLTNKIHDISFYNLKSDSSNWELVSRIEGIQSTRTMVFADSSDVSQNPERKNERKNISFLKKIINYLLLPIRPIVAYGNYEPEQNLNVDKKGTLLAQGKDAGHTFPDIVKGLNIGAFGVYNCDQIYRLQNRITIHANYVDEYNQVINDGKIISLIDLNYNGAFSFSPNSFICDSKANNVLLLFTQSEKLYLLEKGEFQKININSNGIHTFKMKDVTDTLNTTQKLTSYLLGY